MQLADRFRLVRPNPRCAPTPGQSVRRHLQPGHRRVSGLSGHSDAVHRRLLRLIPCCLLDITRATADRDVPFSVKIRYIIILNLKREFKSVIAENGKKMQYFPLKHEPRVHVDHKALLCSRICCLLSVWLHNGAGPVPVVDHHQFGI